MGDAKSSERRPHDGRSGRAGAGQDGERQAAGRAAKRNKILGDAACSTSPRQRQLPEYVPGSSIENVGDACGAGRTGRTGIGKNNGAKRAPIERTSGQRISRRIPLFAPGRDDYAAWEALAGLDASVMPSVERAVRGSADGLASRVEQLRISGNGVVPLCAAVALVALYDRLVTNEVGDGTGH